MPDLGPIQPRHPIYVVSKGRADHPYTIRSLSHYRVPFYVVVEEEERAPYERAVEAHGGYGTVLVLNPDYQRDYDACIDLTPQQSRGSGPARNFAWDHALAAGAERYWCVDDNIMGWWYYNNNRKMHAGDALPIRLMEDFVERYSNVAMAGPNYYMFIVRKKRFPAFFQNTRIYSCNLIRTDLPFRWRGRYNEDTILSLDLLKAGWCTVQFNAWLQWKMRTGNLPGGNQAELYAAGTVEKSRMVVREHPDVTRLVWRYGRPHHAIDYRPFNGQHLILRPDAEPVRYPDRIEQGRTLAPLRPWESE
jgi:hypothetical protein